MIRNRLAILLAERGLRATQVANGTGIARSTLSKITNNASEKIDYSTINTLCRYLNITPCDFFEYAPFDASVTVEIGKQPEYNYDEQPTKWPIEVFLNVDEQAGKSTFEYVGEISEGGPFSMDTGEKIHFVFIEPINQQESDKLKMFFCDLSTSMIASLKNEFIDAIYNQLKSEGFKPGTKDFIEINLINLSKD